MHKIGNYEVIDGTIFSKSTKCGIMEPSIILHITTGGILKIGSADSIKEYWERKIINLPDFAEEYAMLEFNAKTGDEQVDSYYNKNLDIDEVCTLINYMNNHIGEEAIQQLLSMELHQLKDKIKNLQEIGY